MKGNTKGYGQEQHDIPEIEDCLAMLLEEASVQNIQDVEVGITHACGRVLAETVYADIPLPPYSKSAMDGYAVKAEDLQGVSRENPITLKVRGQLLAGDYEEIPYEKNTAVRVMTGAFVPEGYDAVVRQEDTDYGESEVRIFTSVRAYDNYCKVGEDIPEGTVVVECGTRLSPVHIGLLAGVGRDKVKVRGLLNVAVISTGTELVAAGQPLAKGKIYSSVSNILAASMRQEGIQIDFCEICPDEEEILAAKLNEAIEKSDIIITTGGVSVGKKDIVPDVLESVGAKILFRRARIQPGTPTTASVKDGKIILSLSGNPYAAIVNFEIYFWPLVAKLMGNDSFDTVKETAILQSPYPKVNRMRRFIRAKAVGGKVYLPTEDHAASVIRNLTECNCFIDLEAGRQVDVGDEVRIQYNKECTNQL